MTAYDMRISDWSSDVCSSGLSRAAEAEIDRERSLRIPDPVVAAGVRRFEESNDNAFLVGVSIPLPFSNRNQGNIAAAQARLRAATIGRASGRERARRYV